LKARVDVWEVLGFWLIIIFWGSVLKKIRVQFFFSLLAHKTAPFGLFALLAHKTAPALTLQQHLLDPNHAPAGRIASGFGRVLTPHQHLTGLGR
jgi:hypothetical protein